MKAILTGHQPRQLVNNPIPPNVAPAYMPNKDKEASYERTNKLIELQNKLLDTNKEKERVYREGVGWVIHRISP